MGQRKKKRQDARALSIAMTCNEPIVAIGHDKVLIDTRTITAGRLGGILRDNYRDTITSELSFLSSQLGKLRWGAGVLINAYVLKKLSTHQDMLPNLNPVEAGLKRSKRLAGKEKKTYVETTDHDGNEMEVAADADADVITEEVVHNALRCLMKDSVGEFPYKRTYLYAQLCEERDAVQLRNVLGGPIDREHIGQIILALAMRMLVSYQKHLSDYKALLANFLCVHYQDLYLSRAEADKLAQCIVREDTDEKELTRLLPKSRLRQTRWWYHGERNVKRPVVKTPQWQAIVKDMKIMIPPKNEKSGRMHFLYRSYNVIEKFLECRLCACKARHVQFLPAFAVEPYFVPVTTDILSSVLKRRGVQVDKNEIIRECLQYKKLNRLTGLRRNATSNLRGNVPAAAAGGGGAGGNDMSFFHCRRIMRPEFMTTNGYAVNVHVSSVLEKSLLLDVVKRCIKEHSGPVERFQIGITLAKSLKHYGDWDKSDNIRISMVLNWLLLDGSLVLEEGEEDKLLWSLPEDAAMEVDVEMLAAAAAPAPAPTLAPAPPSPIYPALPAPTAAAPDATTAAKASGIPSAEPWIIVDPGEHSVIYSVKASTTDRCGRREQQSLGHGQYPVLQPCLDVSKSFWKHLRRFDEIKKLKKKSGVTDIFLQTRRKSRSRPLQEWQKVIQDFDILKVAVNEGKKESRISFTVQQRQMKGESDVRKVCKEAFGRKGKIAWGSGSWRKGQASGVLLKILLKDDNLRQRIEQTSEVNTSCKCSNCLDIFKMVHPSHPTHGRENNKREVWGMYQCENSKCNMTWHRDKGGTGGIFRRAYCSEFGLALPVTYITTGKASLRKRPRQDNSLMGDELKSKRKR